MDGVRDLLTVSQAGSDEMLDVLVIAGVDDVAEGYSILLDQDGYRVHRVPDLESGLAFLEGGAQPVLVFVLQVLSASQLDALVESLPRGVPLLRLRADPDWMEEFRAAPYHLEQVAPTGVP